MSKRFIIAVIMVFCAGMTSSYAFESGTVMVVSFSGDVKIFPKGIKEFVACEEGLIVKQGARIMTGRDSYVKIAFDENKLNVAKVKEETEVVVMLKEKNKIELIDGAVFTMLKGVVKGKKFQIKTPSATCGARGTGWNTMADRKVTRIEVIENKVFVRGVNKDGTFMEEEFEIDEGFERVVERFKEPGVMERISDDRLDEIRVEKNEIEKLIRERKKSIGGEVSKKTDQEVRSFDVDMSKKNKDHRVMETSRIMDDNMMDIMERDILEKGIFERDILEQVQDDRIESTMETNSDEYIDNRGEENRTTINEY